MISGKPIRIDPAFREFTAERGSRASTSRLWEGREISEQPRQLPGSHCTDSWLPERAEPTRECGSPSFVPCLAERVLPLGCLVDTLPRRHAVISTLMAPQNTPLSSAFQRAEKMTLLEMSSAC